MHKGGWTRVMNRIDNSITAFNKSWQEYTDGFGEDLNSNHWLGLNNLRQLTNQQQMAVRIELSNSKFDSYMIEYDQFVVGPESEKFKLTIGEKIFGTLTNQLSYLNRSRFSTYDDYEYLMANNTQIYNGGWWFNKLYTACLTCQRKLSTVVQGQWCMIDPCTTIGSTLEKRFPFFINTKMLIKPNFSS